MLVQSQEHHVLCVDCGQTENEPSLLDRRCNAAYEDKWFLRTLETESDKTRKLRSLQTGTLHRSFALET